MTIARDFIGAPDFHGDGARTAPEWHPSESLSSSAEAWSVPADMRQQRLDAQIRSFERAGYRLETRSGLQAIVARPLTRPVLRDSLIAVATLGVSLVPRLLGARRRFHRVVITVDGRGVVRLA